MERQKFSKKTIKQKKNFEEILNEIEKDQAINEIINFFQVCPKEMLDKLDNPLSLNKNLSVAV